MENTKNKIKNFFSSVRNIIIFSSVSVTLIAAVIILCVVLNVKSPETDSNLSVYEQVNNLMDKMTLEEKIGQMIVVKESGLKNKDISKIGGVVFDGGGKKLSSADDFVKKAEKLQKKTKKVPLFYGISADNTSLTAVNPTIFPSYYALGATRNSTLISASGKNTAYSLLNAGFNWCITSIGTTSNNTAATDCGNSFVQNVYQNGSFVRDYISGIRSIKSPNRLICSVGGYLGKGYSDYSEYSLPEEIKQGYLNSYSNSIEAGAKIIFISDDRVDTTPCAANSSLIETLKNELKFSGICAADETALIAVSPDLSSAFEQSINSGCDMFVLPKENKSVKTIAKLVKDGKIKQERINDAVKRILTVKVESGLMKNSVNKNAALPENQSELQRLAVLSSPVLLKNSNGVIDKMQSAQNISVVGQAANDLSALCAVSSAESVKGGQTLFGALKELCGDRVSLRKNAAECADSDLIIAVIEGNSAADKNSTICDRDSALLKSIFEVKGQTPVVLLVVCDRPVILANAINDADVCAVIWRPGSQSKGIAELLTGDADFSGLMPCSWLSTMSDLPLYPGKDDNAQFKYGFALKK